MGTEGDQLSPVMLGRVLREGSIWAPSLSLSGDRQAVRRRRAFQGEGQRVQWWRTQWVAQCWSCTEGSWRSCAMCFGCSWSRQVLRDPVDAMERRGDGQGQGGETCGDMDSACTQPYFHGAQLLQCFICGDSRWCFIWEERKSKV